MTPSSAGSGINWLHMTRKSSALIPARAFMALWILWLATISAATARAEAGGMEESSLPAKTCGIPKRNAGGVTRPLNDTFPKLQLCADDIIRVACATEASFFRHKSESVAPLHPGAARWDMKTLTGTVSLYSLQFLALVDGNRNASFLPTHGA